MTDLDLSQQIRAAIDSAAEPVTMSEVRLRSGVNPPPKKQRARPPWSSRRRVATIVVAAAALAVLVGLVVTDSLGDSDHGRSAVLVTPVSNLPMRLVDSTSSPFKSLGEGHKAEISNASPPLSATPPIRSPHRTDGRSNERQTAGRRGIPSLLSPTTDFLRGLLPVQRRMIASARSPPRRRVCRPFLTATCSDHGRWKPVEDRIGHDSAGVERIVRRSDFLCHHAALRRPRSQRRRRIEYSRGHVPHDGRCRRHVEACHRGAGGRIGILVDSEMRPRWRLPRTGTDRNRLRPQCRSYRCPALQ